MRKSEAEHLLEHLRDQYDGPLQLMVGDIREVAGRNVAIPENEPPYVVIGVQPEEQEDEETTRAHGIRENIRSKKEVVAWQEVEGQWKMRRVKSWQVTRTFGTPLTRDVYVYDTRKREFVPVRQFRFPVGGD